jgi:hypothetical protein
MMTESRTDHEAQREDETSEGACCAPTEANSCCAPDAKAQCCGVSQAAAPEAPPPKRCGCR